MSTAGDLRGVADALAALPARALADVAPRAVAEARAVGGRYAPRGIAGRRLGATATVRGAAGGAALEVAASPAGPWRILNDGSRRHPIKPRGAVLAGGLRHPVSEPVAHPGHRGRHVWPDVARTAGDAAADALAAQLDRVVARG